MLHHTGRRRERPPARGRGEKCRRTPVSDGCRTPGSSPPWHYHREAMMVDQAGRMQILPPKVKEQLHDLPPDYTNIQDLDDRARHRLVGNGWHWGVARRLITFLVLATWGSQTTGATTPPPMPSPRTPTWRWMASSLRSLGANMAPPPRQPREPPFLELSADQHWIQSARL